MVVYNPRLKRINVDNTFCHRIRKVANAASHHIPFCLSSVTIFSRQTTLCHEYSDTDGISRIIPGLHLFTRPCHSSSFILVGGILTGIIIRLTILRACFPDRFHTVRVRFPALRRFDANMFDTEIPLIPIIE